MSPTQPYRWSVIYAATWRIIAELVRRHDPALDLFLVQRHPGLSGPGVFSLTRRSAWPDSDGMGHLDFTLGGGAFGRLMVRERFDGAPGPAQSPDGLAYVDQFLQAADPRELVNNVEGLAGLQLTESAPATTPKTLAYRVMAEFLERRCLGLHAHVVSSAHLDSGISEWAMVPDWVKRENATLKSPADYVGLGFIGADLFALHPEGTFADGDLAERSLVVDAREGTVWRHGRYGQRVNLMATYKSAGRRLGPVVNALDELLSS